MDPFSHKKRLLRKVLRFPTTPKTSLPFLFWNFRHETATNFSSITGSHQTTVIFKISQFQFPKPITTSRVQFYSNFRFQFTGKYQAICFFIPQTTYRPPTQIRLRVIECLCSLFRIVFSREVASSFNEFLRVRTYARFFLFHPPKLLLTYSFSLLLVFQR